jgi:hypothetical protein
MSFFCNISIAPWSHILEIGEMISKFSMLSAWAAAISLATVSAALSHDQGRHRPAHHARHLGQRDYAQHPAPGGFNLVPQKGVIDEACNLPTSACPNDKRDVN